MRLEVVLLAVVARLVLLAVPVLLVVVARLASLAVVVWLAMLAVAQGVVETFDEEAEVGRSWLAVFAVAFVA